MLRGQPGHPAAGRGARGPTAAPPPPAPSLPSRSPRGTHTHRHGSGIRESKKPRPPAASLVARRTPLCRRRNPGGSHRARAGVIRRDPSLRFQLGWAERQGSEGEPSSLGSGGPRIPAGPPARASSARGGETPAERASPPTGVRAEAEARSGLWGPILPRKHPQPRGFPSSGPARAPCPRGSPQGHLCQTHM